MEFQAADAYGDVSSKLDPGVCTQQRQELARWLHERVPSFEQRYLGALQLLNMRDFPGRVHLVCHIVRDIYRRLRLGNPGTVKPPGRTQFRLKHEYSKRWFASGPNSKEAMACFTLPPPATNHTHEGRVRYASIYFRCHRNTH